MRDYSNLPPEILFLSIVFWVFVFLVLRALWRIGSKK